MPSQLYSNGRGMIQCHYNNFIHLNSDRSYDYQNRNNYNDHRYDNGRFSSVHHYNNHRMNYYNRNYRQSPRFYTNNHRYIDYHRSNYESNNNNNNNNSFIAQSRRRFNELTTSPNQNRQQSRRINSNSNNDLRTYVQQRQSSWNTNQQNKNKNNNNKINSHHPYLEENQILKWFKSNSCGFIINQSDRGTRTFVLTATSHYNDWIQSSDELELWETYLGMGKINNYWSQEVLQYTKSHDYETNIGFVKRKINQLNHNITEIWNKIGDLKVQLKKFWARDVVHKRLRWMHEMCKLDNSPPTPTEDEEINELQIGIIKYIIRCTQHVTKMTETKKQISKAQMEYFLTL
ncbi:unnamed protein product [Rotaria sp. Silwood2]|nr:unnamed protein product [Rotaria sp. Silwood2]CAF4223243.1 unnamed protein product [Rotaria sp. Silwood2]